MMTSDIAVYLEDKLYQNACDELPDDQLEKIYAASGYEVARDMGHKVKLKDKLTGETHYIFA